MRSKWTARSFAKIAALFLLLAALALFLYGFKGYYDAGRDSPALVARADRLIAANRGAAGLGPGRLERLLLVEDPGFWTHNGVDLTTPGSGLTTLTESLAKRLAFAHFRPGIGKIRQIGYAMGLERRLSKPQIVALFLDTAEMGPGRNGWMRGFYNASLETYGRPVAALDERQFLSLVAVLIAPRSFKLQGRDPRLQERVGRIERLVLKRCRPENLRDVWLEGCAGPPAEAGASAG